MKSKSKTDHVDPAIAVNTLVTHRKLPLGIGCVSNITRSSIKVNFGMDATMQCKTSMLNVVDTTKCKTIPYSKFQSRILDAKSALNNCIVGNEVLHYVGIGWISIRVVTEDDLTKYPRVTH